MSLLDELKRRNVFKVGAAYLVVGWLIIEVASTVAPQLSLPEWAPRLITLIIMLGFPIALVLAWVFDMTPEGVQITTGRTGSRRFYAAVVVLFAATLGWFLYEPTPESTIPELGEAPSIAVLPFAVLTQDPDTMGLAGGLHDTLITQLSRLHGLEVRSRTSVMRYQDWTGGLPVIAEELGVSIILEGSVQRLGNRTVVNAQLINARSDAHVWAETFDLTNDDLFALQADIAQRVVSALQIALTAEERAALTTAPTQDQEAYALYTQGLRFLYEADSGGPTAERDETYMRAIEVLETAVERDPQFALAWATLARTYASLAWNSLRIDYREISRNARRAAEEAIALGSNLAEARYARGVVALQLDFDFERAEQEFRAAVAGMPSNADAVSRLGVTLRYLSRWEESIEMDRRAVELDPTSRRLIFVLMEALYSQKAWAEMRTLARRVALLNPGGYVEARRLPELEAQVAGSFAPLTAFVRGAGAGFRAHPSLTQDLVDVALAEGDFDGAMAIVNEADPAALPNNWDFTRARVMMLAGQADEARNILNSTREEIEGQLVGARDPFIEALARTQLAWVLAHLGDAEAARENIIRARALWGFDREPADGGRVEVAIVWAETALGNFDAAVAALRPVVTQPSYFPAQRVWMNVDLAELHRHQPFLDLMRSQGVDVTRSPFAAMLAAGED